MEGWHPDGYPGNLAYSPELWEWMFELGLYLNFDPSHLLWLGIDPVEALQALRRPRRARAREGRRDVPDAAQPLRLLRPDLDARADPWDMGWWRYRIPGLGRGRLPPLRRRALRGRLRRRAVGRARGPGVGRHARAGRGGPAHRPQPPAPDGGPDDDAILEVRDLVKEYPGVKALQGVDLDVLAGEVHCLLGPNGAGKSTLIKCVSGAVEPTSGEILVRGRAAAAGRARGVARRAASATIYQELDLVEDLTRRREHLPRPRAAPRAAARPRRDAPRDRRRCSRGSVTSDIPPRAKVARAAAGGAADRLDRPRAVAATCGC